MVSGIGVSLLVFAVGLLRNSSRLEVNQAEAWTAVAMDLAWVAGSVAVISTGALTVGGNWLVAVVADVVLLFAVLQVMGLRRVRFARPA